MNCELVQTSLLQAESLQPASWPADLADHVRSCPSCAKLSQELTQIEEAWRRIPLPAECEQAKAVFLQQLPRHAAAVRSARRRWVSARWAVAAALLIGVGLAAWMLSPTESRASSDLVERLIDWNLELTGADVANRQRLHAEKEASFRQDLQLERLPADERELAEELFENGCKMAKIDDPLQEADDFTKLADKLVGRIDAAAQQGSVQETQRNASRYCKVMESGVHPNMSRVMQNKSLHAKKKIHVDRIDDSDRRQEQQLEQVMRRAPEIAHKDVRKALDTFRKHLRHHRAQKK